MKDSANHPVEQHHRIHSHEGFCVHWVFHYKPPAHLLPDNGGQFTAKFFQDVCAIPGIPKLFTTAYHPQTNGQVERFNRTSSLVCDTFARNIAESAIFLPRVRVRVQKYRA